MKNPFVAIASALLTLGLTGCLNTIQRENVKPGTRGWELSDVARDREIEGYASTTSTPRGSVIKLFVNTIDPGYSIEVYRMGWYQGIGARRVFGPVTASGTVQQGPSINSITGLVECDWTHPYVLTIPKSSNDSTDWASGVYLAKLMSLPKHKQCYVVFTIRDDDRHSDILFQTSVTTYEAYNRWGGGSLYWSPILSPSNPDNGQARKVSFDRPYESPGAGQFLNYEYQMLRFLEREGYDVTYCTNVDTHERPDLLLTHSTFLSVGHDEYWSRDMRVHVETARDRGVNLGFFSANTCNSQIRFEPDSQTKVPNRTVVCYKRYANSEDPVALDGDASNDNLITTEWRDYPLYSPEDDLIGVMYAFFPVSQDVVISDASHWVCAGTGLHDGDHLTPLVGYEADRVVNNTRNVHVIAHSPVPSATCQDTFTTPCVPWSDMVVYEVPSGATVFATGTIEWSLGLDDYGMPSPSLVDDRARQMTRNVLDRFIKTKHP